MASATTAPAPVQMVQAVAGLPPPDMNLPVLAPVPNRQQYRQRTDEETEEAQWYSQDEPDTLVEPQQVRLKSIHSKQASVIVFKNNSPHHVRCLWIDFKGNEVVYSVLEPKSSKRYHTYITHPWIVREVQSGTRMLLSGRPAVVGLSTEQTVEVQPPPQLDWNLSTHCCFPEHYKSEVKALLLSHKKLEPYAAPGPANINTLAARTTACSPTKRSAVAPAAFGATSCKPPVSPMSPRNSIAARVQHSTASTPASHASKRLTMGVLPPAGASSTCTSSSSYSLPVLPRITIPATDADDLATTTTSISICNEAANFKATFTVTSPKRAVVSSCVNIELLTGTGFNSQTMVNIGLGEHSAAAAAQACNVPPAKKGGFLSMFKNILHPKHNSKAADATALPSTTTFKVEVQTQQQDDTHVADQNMDDDVCWPPMDTHLGHLPSHLLVYIAELAHPPAWQTLAQPPKGRPDVKPTLMACPPLTPEQEQEQEQQQQQELQQQQQQHQQQQQ